MADKKEFKREYKDVSFKVPWGHVEGRWYGGHMERPILALHGWQDNLGTWDRLIPLLPRHIGILCIDFPGHGRSSKYPVGILYNAIDYVQLIARVVQEFKWHKVSLMGHSMGAIVSFIYAALYPHMIDLLIQIDLVTSIYYPPNKEINKIHALVEGALIENERLEKTFFKEPTSFLYQEFEDMLHKGSGYSVEKQNSKYILDRSIKKSQLYPDKYYFSRDSRIKYIVEMSGELGMSVEMAKRIKNIAYILIGSDTNTSLTAMNKQVIDVLRANNAHFEYHTVYNCTHHLHLNNAKAVAAVLNPFILRYRPLTLGTLSVDNDRRRPGMESKL